VFDGVLLALLHEGFVGCGFPEKNVSFHNNKTREGVRLRKGQATGAFHWLYHKKTVYDGDEEGSRKTSGLPMTFAKPYFGGRASMLRQLGGVR
jgi:hypothetical protein